MQESLYRYTIARGRYLKLRQVMQNREIEADDHDWIEAKEGLKMELDRLIACWRDIIHEYLTSMGNHPKLLHGVMDAMNLFIDRSKA